MRVCVRTPLTRFTGDGTMAGFNECSYHCDTIPRRFNEHERVGRLNASLRTMHMNKCQEMNGFQDAVIPGRCFGTE